MARARGLGFAQIVQERRLTTLFQPICDADRDHVVGLEALVQGPPGSRFADASSLFAEAYRLGEVVELDWAARASACRAAVEFDIPTNVALFLNIEPLALSSECPSDLADDIDNAFHRYPVVLEVTERSLERDPSALLAGVERQRANVAGLAIDDVGARSEPLAMLPVLAPDVIKLDMTVTHQPASTDALIALDVAYEEAERTGATLLAEGVETPEHLQTARTFGARLLQGHYLGEPQAAPLGGLNLADFQPVRVDAPEALARPFQALANRPVNQAERDLLLALMQHITESLPIGGPALVLVLVPDQRALAAMDGGRLAKAAEAGVAVAALGPDLPVPPAPGVRSGWADEELGRQAAAVVLAPGVATAVLAEQIDETNAFRYAVTHDRGRVVRAAQSLLRHVGPL